MAKLVEKLLFARLSEKAGDWFTAALDKAEAQNWLNSYAMVSRKLPKLGHALEEAEQQSLAEVQLDWLCPPGVEFQIVELARVALLTRMSLHNSGERTGEVLSECFRLGDNGEKRAVLRALSLVSSPQLLVELAVNACRTNVVEVFEAICCENPFPARYFPQSSFNQMILKALFIEVRLGRVIGLDGLKSMELARMARDYEAERRAAGRSIPEDIAMLTVEENS